MSYYVTLSSGCYSDYSADHFVGEQFISQEDFTAKGVEFGDQIVLWWSTLERTGTRGERIDENGVRVWRHNEFTRRWRKRMEAWLAEMGYKPVELGAEINIDYSDIPTTEGLAGVDD